MIIGSLTPGGENLVELVAVIDGLLTFENY